jgi:hypothetical protein
MGDLWYVRSRNRIEGPFTHSELRQAALAGHVTPETLVSQSRESGWVAAKRIGDLKFGTTIEPSQPLRSTTAKKSPRSFHGRKTWVVLGVGGAALAALMIAWAYSRRDKTTPLVVANKSTVEKHAPAQSAKNPTSGQAATKSAPPRLITQRWQRKWLQQH